MAIAALFAIMLLFIAIAFPVWAASPWQGPGLPPGVTQAGRISTPLANGVGGGAIAQSALTAIPYNYPLNYNQQTWLYGYNCFYQDPISQLCATEPVTITTITPPQHGKLTFGTVPINKYAPWCKNNVNGFFPNVNYVAYYTWTDKSTKAAV